MINADGKIMKNAFPTDELLALKCKKGVSVDRCNLLKDPEKILHQKAKEIANPKANRKHWGYCIGKVKQIKSIVGNKSQQVFKISPDPISDENNPKPWHLSHTIIVVSDPSCTRADLRGYRDKLTQVFSSKIVDFNRTHS